ncbi:hypothetical protein AB6A40_011480 [Gnathostoma spinigerum]|uniref:Uncharacterized protein n=1 Tax=Gnathostoma spinigerum TaxID=75299 RepID=A0ABD6EXX7_9BILA
MCLEKIIENKGCGHKQNEFRLPEHRLRGFMVLGLSNNNITRLPSEEDLKEKFPDLVAVDVEGNKVFDCNSTKEYKTIRGVSMRPPGEKVS